MNKIKKLLNREDFYIDVDYGDYRTKVTKKTGHFTVEFVVNYKKSISNYIPSDYYNPSECDLEIEIEKVTDLEIYNDDKDELIEFTDLQMIELISILEDKLVGKTL